MMFVLSMDHRFSATCEDASGLLSPLSLRGIGLRYIGFSSKVRDDIYRFLNLGIVV